MLFSEVYGSYFNVVADVISKAIDGDLDSKGIYDAVFQKAFGESAITIPNSLLNGDWRLMDENCETPILSKPKMPLTTLQKRWLKALLLDERIQLFNPSIEGLEDVEPLFKPDTFVYFDRYLDGDNFSDPIYKRNFGIILNAIRQHQKVRIKYCNRNNIFTSLVCIPKGFEYSSKDDKMRLNAIDNKDRNISINIARIIKTYLLEGFTNDDYTDISPQKEKLVLELVDERSALERAMLHFSHFEKETEKLDDSHYRISLSYNSDDETEVLIRVLSFGPKLRVVSPSSFVDLIKKRIDKQEGCEH